MAEDFRAIFEGFFFAEEKSGDEIVADSIYIYIYNGCEGPARRNRKSDLWCFGIPWYCRMPDWWHRLSWKRSMSFPMALLRKTRKMSRRWAEPQKHRWPCGHVAMGIRTAGAVSSLAGLAGPWLSGLGKAVACPEILHHGLSMFIIYNWSFWVNPLFTHEKHDFWWLNPRKKS